MPLIHNPPMSHTEHKKLSPAIAHCYILTVSDTRTLATDASGRTICDLLWAEGHQVMGRKVVRDEPDQVREAVEAQLASAEVQVAFPGLAARFTLLDRDGDGYLTPEDFGRHLGGF